MNLVLGTAWGLGVPHIRYFAESLRHHYKGQAALVIAKAEQPELLEYLRRKDIQPIVFDDPHWKDVHIQVSRYAAYRNFLSASGNLFGHVLLSDVVDVLFQGDPFANLPDGDPLFFLEAAGRTISQCSYNTQWVTDLYGKSGCQQIGDQQISCSGTTIGTHRAIMGYLDKLLGAANIEILRGITTSPGHDQAIHNYLIRTGAFPNAGLIPNGLHVYTMGYVADDEFSIGPNQTILAPGRRLCPIIHQYNYKAEAIKKLLDARAC